jgi:hypothetical protein
MVMYIVYLVAKRQNRSLYTIFSTINHGR